MRAIIVGGGIGGIAAAIALRKEGFEPVVLEQARAITPIGAGIHVYPNGLKVLDYLGAGDRVRANAVVSEEEIYADLHTGQRIAQRQLFGSGLAARVGDYCYAMHRAVLMGALIDTLPSKCIRLNRRVVSFAEHPKGVHVGLENGEEIEGDLLIGADGLKSRIRAALFGDTAPQFMNYIGWRTVFPISAMRHRPIRGFTIWSGFNRAVSWYPIGRDLIYMGAFVPADKVQEESWDAAGVAENLAAAFPGACEPVTDAFQAIAKHALSVTMTGLFYREPLSTWGRGAVTLLGDAAHPSPPTVGQGSGMAMEDAVMLARTLRRHGRSGLVAALREYEVRRTPRTAAMNLVARAMMKQQMESSRQSSEDQARRTHELQHRRLRTLGRLDPTGDITFGWLTKYDPVAVAGMSLQEEIAASGIEQHMPRRAEALAAFEKLKGAITPDDRTAGWHGERAAYERFMSAMASPSAQATVARVDCNGIKALKLGDGSGPAVLFLHGGGYTMGSAASALALAEKIANAVGGWALIPDYRLAPEHPWPSGPEDALIAYRWLIDRYPAENVLVSGNCAGGGIALGLAIKLRDAGEALPAGLHLLSPLLDLSLTALSIDRNSGRDPWFNRGVLTQLSASYIPEHTDPARSDISPLFAKLFGLPPVLLQVAESEALRDDATRFAIAARKEGVEVTLDVVPDTVHSFMLFDFLPETTRALERLRAFFGDILIRPRCPR